MVGVIGPWSYPVFTPMGSIAYALAAGNAVVFEPSEFTPAVGAWLAEAWRAAVPDVPDALQVVTGLGATGAALCRAGVGRLAFTGSAATGRAVTAACAETLTLVLMELGGKDAMIVDDADVTAAADAAVWGAMSNAGQTCIGIERIYATAAGHDRFVAEVTGRVAALRPGSDADASYGPMTMASQTDVVRRHRDVRRGAGGALRPDADHHRGRRRRGGAGPGERQHHGAGRVGVQRPAGPRAGPGPPDAQRDDLGQLRAHLRLGAGAALRWCRESGFGRIHGEDGLREFTRADAVTRKRAPLPVDAMSFGRPAGAADAIARVLHVVHDRHR
ncbi:aldehyde dehydrogenase family protein [Modestobacter sp. SYSU DS0875]